MIGQPIGTVIGAPVTSGAPGINVGFFANQSEFFTAVVAPEGVVIVSAGYFEDPDTFFPATITQTGAALQIAVGFFVDPDTFYPATMIYRQIILPSRYNASTEFFDHTVYTPFVVPPYTYPISRGLESDYGLRSSRLRRSRYIIGRR